MDQSVTAQYKIYANDIVGTWYNEAPGEILVFSFLYNYTQDADVLIIKEGNHLKTTYSLQIKSNDNWFLTIWHEQLPKKTIYFIEALNPNMLVLRAIDGQLRMYLRKIDYAFVQRTLENAL